ncbi:hypothetical protein [Microcystis phage MaeS]|nr:hypothetical protein [Microcystis phage MaeS]
MARKDMTYEQLQKANRIMARQLGQLKKDVKVDVQKLRNDSLKEGYNNAISQVQPQLDQVNELHDEIERLQKLLQDYGILY